MKKIFKFIKNYQSYIVLLSSYISTDVILAIINFWFNIKITLQFWHIFSIITLIFLIHIVIKILKSKQIFEKGTEVIHKGRTTKMIVIEFDIFKNKLLCSYSEGRLIAKKWFSQDELSIYTPLKPINPITKEQERENNGNHY
jgi:hypothetical protein